MICWGEDGLWKARMTEGEDFFTTEAQRHREKQKQEQLKIFSVFFGEWFY